MSLPELPEPSEIIGVVVGDDQSSAYRYTAEDMRAYALAVAEECAKLCDAVAAEFPNSDDQFDSGYNLAGEKLAADIRAKFGA